MKEITIKDVITASGTYPDRLNSKELTPEVIKNIEDLLKRVNGLLTELGIKEVKITSGFRPSSVNANIANASKKSAHMIGKAIDILDDKNQTLGKLIRTKQANLGTVGILAKYGLMMEALESTVGTNTNWVHLDSLVRIPRPSMEFKP